MDEFQFGAFNGSKVAVKDRARVREGAGGGVVALICSGGVTNNGTMDCKASDSEYFCGGTVMISTDDTFENDGDIDCGQDGVVLVDCAKFVNSGCITPVPTVVFGECAKIEQWMDGWILNIIIKSISLRVHNCGGYYPHHHPKHLLTKHRQKHYEGAGIPSKDWIIFEVLEREKFIPTKVEFIVLSALRRISLFLGTESNAFYPWVQIEGGQYTGEFVFNLDEVSSHFAWRKAVEYIKIRLKSWDNGRHSRMAEFFVHGKVLR